MPPKGKCKDCGRAWYGWALENGDHKCTCGGEIVICPDKGKPKEEHHVSDNTTG